MKPTKKKIVQKCIIFSLQHARTSDISQSLDTNNYEKFTLKFTSHYIIYIKKNIQIN